MFVFIFIFCKKNIPPSCEGGVHNGHKIHNVIDFFVLFLFCILFDKIGHFGSSASL